MGANKNIRRNIEGHKKQLAEHLLKLDNELKRDFPNQGLVAKWEKDIRNIRKHIATLESKLPGRRRE